MLELMLDPAIWIGLFSLILLEIVLGIDNLIFIAILADKLPPHQRDRARQVGLVLALVMRLGLLASISWLVTLTDPLFSVFGKPFSGRDLILFGGGLFLLFKGTMELHERLEGHRQQQRGPRLHAGFGIVVTQIVVLDAVFSLDSVITAVGMVDHLAVMMIAVTVAIVIMLLASKPLTRFVNAHPTVVILCLGFLMMIGFALVADGLGFHIPKSYLYAAIGFSVLIELLNQLAGANRRRQLAHPRRFRERTAEAVLKLLGGRHEDDDTGEADADDVETEAVEAFKPAERHMIRSVLRLADAPIQAQMTPRPDIAWLDVEAAPETVLAMMQAHPYSRFLVCEGELDQLLGVVQSRDMLAHALAHVNLNLRASLSQPLIVPELMSSLDVLEALRQHPVPMAVVIDEYGGVLGVVTTGDLLAAIAGELIDTADPEAPQIVEEGEGRWLLDGGLPLGQLSDLLGIAIADTEYYTLAGLVLAHLQRVPAVGDYFELDGYRFETAATEGHRIQRVRVTRPGGEAARSRVAEGH